MPSKTALRRDRIARAVIRGARNNVELVNETLAERLAVDGAFQELQAGENLIVSENLSEGTARAVATLEKTQKAMEPFDFPDWAELQQALTWLTAFYTRLYLVVDDVHQQEAAEDWVPRDRRDEAVRSAYDDLVAVRRYVSGVLDERAASSLLGLTDRTPSQPDELRSQMESVLRRLQEPSSHVPTPRIEGLEADWEPAIRQLERGLKNLDEALENLADETKAARHARDRKEAALAAHRDAVTGCRSILRGVYILSGRRDLVDTIRSPFSSRGPIIDLEEEDEDVSVDEPFDPPEAEGEPSVGEAPEEGPESEQEEVSP